MIDHAEIIETIRRLTGHLKQLSHTLEQIDDDCAQQGDPRSGARSYAKRVSELLAAMRSDLDTPDASGYRRKARYWAQKFGSIDRIVDASFTNSRHAVELDALITQIRNTVTELLVL